MARSVQTQPWRLRADRRVRTPFAPRDQNDRRREWRRVRSLKDQGLIADARQELLAEAAAVRWPRLIAQHPRPGHIFAISLADIRQMLMVCGAHTVYGLQRIELVQGKSDTGDASLCLGQLSLPGQIRLYDHRPSPWIVPQRLSSRETERLGRAGAQVEQRGQGLQTVISWPGETLREFILFDVLMHEIGHHLIQQASGQYRRRVKRTADHEALALQFAQSCRRLYAAREPQW